MSTPLLQPEDNVSAPPVQVLTDRTNNQSTFPYLTRVCAPNSLRVRAVGLIGKDKCLNGKEVDLECIYDDMSLAHLFVDGRPFFAFEMHVTSVLRNLLCMRLYGGGGVRACACTHANCINRASLASMCQTVRSG